MSFLFFDKDFNLIDSGVHDDPEWTVCDVARDLLSEGDAPPFVNLNDFIQVDYEEITKKALAQKNLENDSQYDLNHRGINENSSLITVEGHIGTWYVIDTAEINGTAYFLLEHEEHGDEAACVIVDGDGKLVLDDVWNGFDDLQYHFDSLEVPAPALSDEKKPPFDVMEFNEQQWEQIKMGWDNDLDVSAYANPALSAEQMEEIRLDLGNNTPLPEPPVEEHSSLLPDPTVSIDDRNAYGYVSDELLPLSQERATELFEQDLTVYLLYEDNTEAMAFDRADIDNHSGLFGIEKADWLALQEYAEMKGDGKLTPEMSEQLFMERTDDAFAIYQLKDGEELRDYRFEGLDWLKSRELSVDHANYNFIYTEPFTQPATTQERLMEIWERFNLDHPADFKGHSLSVSDIVAIKQDGVVTYHYCDSFDFKELPHFVEPAPLVPDNFVTGEKIDTPRGSFSLTSMTKEQMEQAGYGLHHSSDDGAYLIMGNGTRAFAIRNEDNPLRTAELSTEQNYNQIDGILNNQPTVAQLEQDAKSGKPISLMDLLDATRREEKQSVMEQLKTKPPQTQEKSKKSTLNRCRNGAMIMSRFTVEESNLMCIYNTGSRADLLSELAEMQSHLAADETELLALTKTVMEKLSAMSDTEFESLSGELIPDFEEQED